MSWPQVRILPGALLLTPEAAPVALGFVGVSIAHLVPPAGRRFVWGNAAQGIPLPEPDIVNVIAAVDNQSAETRSKLIQRLHTADRRDTYPMKNSRPAIFWIACLASLIAVVGSVIRIVSSPNDGVTELVIILSVSVLLISLVVLAFAWAISTRMRRASRQLPSSFAVPIVVGDALAAALYRVSTILGSNDLRLWSTTYATLAFDQNGIHVFRGQRRQPGLIPVADLVWGGIGATLVGARQMDAFVFQFISPAGTVELPIVPVRLRGNVLSALTPNQVEETRRLMIDALRGTPSQRLWPF